MCYFDMFSIYFSDGTLMAGNRTYPLGEITTELLNFNSNFFKNLQSKTDDFVPAAREMIASKNANAAADVQQKLNAVYDLLIELPPYRDIGIDIPTSYHMFPMLVEQADKWQEATTPGLDGCQRMQAFLSGFESLFNNLVTFLNQIDIMLEGYFDPLKCRSKDLWLCVCKILHGYAEERTGLCTGHGLGNQH